MAQARRLNGKVVVVKGGDLRKVRSPLNHQVATPKATTEGEVLETPSGQRFNVRRLK